MSMDKIEELLTRGVERIYPSKEALEKVLRSGKKLRLYQGFDPSMPNLHLGNLVGINKLRQFQELGHEVIFLVGDFTGMIGDPTDKSATRQKLTREQTVANTQNWKDQAGRLISFSGTNPAKILFNSQWLDKISFKDLIEISSNFTVQQMIERDFFQKRIQEGKPIHLHEFLYPLAVSIDCMEMDVDLEIGGNDQTFNMLAGRTLMAAMKDKEKFVLATKLLVDSGGNKVGKTAGNALFLNATPEEMFGGIMTFPDEVIGEAFEMLTAVPMEKLEEVEKRLKSGENPMVLKKELASEIVAELYGLENAKKAQEEFEKKFQEQKIEEMEVPEIRAKSVEDLISTGAVASKSEWKRLVSQGAIERDGEKIEAEDDITPGVYRIGKRKFLKIT